MSRLSVAIVLLVVAFAVAQNPFSQTLNFQGVGGADMAFPSQMLTTPNVAGPVTVTVLSTLKDVEICAQPFSGTHPPLKANCGGSYVKTENATNEAEVHFSRKEFGSFATNKRLSSRFVGSARYALETTADEAYTLSLLPNTQYFITVFSDDNTTATTVSVTFSTAKTCAVGEYGPDCVQPQPLAATGVHSVQVATKAFAYFSYSAQGSWSNITFDTTENDYTVMFRLGALPDANNMFAFPKRQKQTHGDASSFQLVDSSPANMPWIIVLHNDDADTLTFNITTNSVICDPPTSFGWNCSHTEAAITLASNTNTSVQHVEVDDDDLSSTFTYYKVDTTGAPALGDIIRFSVVSDKGSNSAPIYARWGAAPTLARYDLNASRNYVNQLLLPKNGPVNAEAQEGFDNSWYVGVFNNGRSYSHWVGANCQNNCSGEVMCVCAAGVNGTCADGAEYMSSTSGDDSYGACPCTSTKKNNFDCSDKRQSSGSSNVLMIVLIVIGVIAGIAVLAGIAGLAYFYIQNRKRSNYDRV